MFEYFEPFIALNLPKPQIDTSALQWVQYNPRKTIARWGSSLTSLDGGATGIPDLDSLYEFNKINGTTYREADFKVKTETYKKNFQFLDEKFELGRSHIIKLGQGGFFPYHRDLDPNTFRLIYTMSGCEPHNFVMILNNQVLNLAPNNWYYINTKMIHTVFSFFGCEFAVFNVINNEKSQRSLVSCMQIK